MDELVSTAAGTDSAVAAGPVTFDEFVHEYLSALVRFGKVLTGSDTAGEELAQAALVKTYPKWSGLRGSPQAYVRKAMVNTYASWWRRRIREIPREKVDEVQVADRAGEVELEKLMWAALARVPARRRAALVLRFYEDLTMEDIAETLGCRNATARSLVARGLDSLRAAPELADHELGTNPLAAGQEES